MAKPAPRTWRRFARRVLLPVALLGLLAVGAANAYVISTTARDIVGTVAAAPARPVAIVLGTKVFPGGVLSVGLAARTEVALGLYEAGKVQRIVLSGAAHVEQDYDEPGAMAAWLERRGVPRSALILDRLGHRTAATMANAASQGFREVLVCTQEFHLPRSLYLARHAGLVATGVIADDPNVGVSSYLRARIRELAARAETLVEVAVRGVRP
jgi:SanA protein